MSVLRHTLLTPHQLLAVVLPLPFHSCWWDPLRPCHQQTCWCNSSCTVMNQQRKQHWTEHMASSGPIHQCSGAGDAVADLVRKVSLSGRAFSVRQSKIQLKREVFMTSRLSFLIFSFKCWTEAYEQHLYLCVLSVQVCKGQMESHAVALSVAGTIPKLQVVQWR